MKKSLVLLLTLFPVYAFAQNANVNCFTGTSPSGKPVWAPASSATPCPVTGHISAPSSAGSSAANTTVAVSSGTPVTLFNASTITNGCFVQNPFTNAVNLIVDWGGGTPASPVAAESIAPGAVATCQASYTNAVTMWLASGTTSVTVYAGKF